MNDKKATTLDELDLLRKENDRLREALRHETEKTDSQRVRDIALRVFVRAAVAVESLRDRIVGRSPRDAMFRPDETADVPAAPPPDAVDHPADRPVKEVADAAIIAEPMAGVAEMATPKRPGYRISIRDPMAPPSHVKFKGGAEVFRAYQPEDIVTAPVATSTTDWKHCIVKRSVCVSDVDAPWSDVAKYETNEVAEAKVKALSPEADTLYRVMRGDVIMSTWTTIDGNIVRLPYPDKGSFPPDLDWVSGWESKWNAEKMLERSRGFFSPRDQWRAVKACLATNYVASAERDACIAQWDAHFESGAEVRKSESSEDWYVSRVLRGELAYAMRFSCVDIKQPWSFKSEAHIPKEFSAIVRRELPLSMLLRPIAEVRIEARPLADGAAGWDLVSVAYDDESAEKSLRETMHCANTLYRVIRGAAPVSMWAVMDSNGITRVPIHGAASGNSSAHTDIVSGWIDADNTASMVLNASLALSKRDLWTVVKACLADGYVHTKERDAYIAQQDEFFASGAPVTAIKYEDSIDSALVRASAGNVAAALQFANDPPQGTWSQYTFGGGGYWKYVGDHDCKLPARYGDIMRREITLAKIVRALIDGDNNA